ncbi:NifU family protein [Dictyobacter aurantiacus]|uniref:NIF system FeS cluster assembly NifU C-terminal domain-containing protein n=1 Tax=Dictyobacter aurantiacus TaxID=1936993 RepID=A0A401ZNK5_9CHLR|nr:NifU family protein [Dictyobacter aurantiacus]GCE08431.1 hypothetical protein KDAU_57600 [Dictyobacter aurantiacus]
MQQDKDQQQVERMESLVQQVAAFEDQGVRAAVQELVQCTMAMYGEGLTRMLALIGRHGECGAAIIEQFGADDLVGPLLLLHGLHPVDTRTRVLGALKEVRPSLQAHGGDVELVRIEQGVAYFKMMGSGNGCSDLVRELEDAVYKVAPELDDVIVNTKEQGSSHPVTFMPKRRRKPKPAVSTGTGED